MKYKCPPWGPMEGVAGDGGMSFALYDEPVLDDTLIEIATVNGPLPGRLLFQPGKRPQLHVTFYDPSGGGAPQAIMTLPWRGLLIRKVDNVIELKPVTAPAKQLPSPDQVDDKTEIGGTGVVTSVTSSSTSQKAEESPDLGRIPDEIIFP